MLQVVNKPFKDFSKAKPTKDETNIWQCCFKVTNYIKQLAQVSGIAHVPKYV